jgi:hypothetical protein
LFEQLKLKVSNICGFFLRDPPIYQPPPDLDDFLRAGLALVYIGLESIACAIDDPAKVSSLILELFDFVVFVLFSLKDRVNLEV